MINLIFGSIDDTNYVTGYKVGSQALLGTAKNAKVIPWEPTGSNPINEPCTILIRHPYRKILSGLIQVLVFNRPPNINEISYKDIPPFQSCKKFLVRNLNNHWTLLKSNPHLSKYHEYMYKLTTKFDNYKVLDITDWNIKNLNTDLMHSNKEYYPSLEKALKSKKLKKRFKYSIDKLIEREIYYYELLTKLKE